MYTLKNQALLWAAVLTFLSAVDGYTYTCHPNNTISISGLPTTFASMNYFALQSDDGSNCTVTGNKPAGTAEIHACNKDVPIYFTFGTYPDMLQNQIHGGKEVEILNITCYEIESTGVAESISNSLRAIITFKETKDLNVTYDITSALNVSTANVGDPVEWTINFPLNYTLEVTSCTAYPGTAVTTANSIHLITNWCSSETDLITDFATNSENTVASAVIQAFKFFNYDSIYLRCNVKVCPTSGGSCDASCGSRKRRSSDISEENVGGFETKLGRVLYVTDPNSAPAQPFPSLFISVLLTTLVYMI